MTLNTTLSGWPLSVILHMLWLMSGLFTFLSAVCLWFFSPIKVASNGIILSYPLADYFEFRACLAGRCLCSQNIYKYSNKPAKGYKRIIRRTLVYVYCLILLPVYLLFFSVYIGTKIPNLRLSNLWDVLPFTMTLCWTCLENILIWRIFCQLRPCCHQRLYHP